MGKGEVSLTVLGVETVVTVVVTTEFDVDGSVTVGRPPHTLRPSQEEGVGDGVTHTT